MTKRGNCRAGEGENAQAEHWLPYLKDKLGLSMLSPTHAALTPRV